MVRRRGRAATELDPFSGAVSLSRPTRPCGEDAVLDGQGLVLYSKRLERRRFVWPTNTEGVVSLTPAQLSMLTEGIDWRMPLRTWRPELAG